MDDRAAVARHGLELSGSQFVERGRADGHAEPAHTTAQYGWITGAFLVTYPLGGPLTGYLMDRVGLRMGFLLCGVAWSPAVAVAPVLGPNAALCGARLSA